MLVPAYIQNDLVDWQNFVKACPQSTIYHTLSWKKVVSESFQHRAYCVQHCDLRGSIDAIAPLYSVGFPFRKKKLISVPFRDYGGPLAVDETALCAIVDDIVELGQKLKCSVIELRNPSLDSHDILLQKGFKRREVLINSIIELNKPSDVFWDECLRSPTRRAVNKAKKSGLTTQWLDSENDMMQFYDLFVLTRRTLGIPPFPKKFFKNIHTYMFPSQQAKLLGCFRDRKMVAGLILLIHKQDIYSGYIGYHPAVLELRPNDLLFWTALEWGMMEGYKRFLFGADSPNQATLLAYKKKWNAVQQPISFFYFMYGTKKPSALDLDQKKYGLMRRIFSKMPLPILKLLGTLAVRFIG